MKRLHSARFVFWLLACGAALVLFSGIMHDRYDVTWFASDMASDSGKISSVSRHAEPENAQAGLFTTSNTISLRAGRYTATIRYVVTDGDDSNQWVLRGGRGLEQQEFFRQNLPAEQGLAMVEFTLPQPVDNLQFLTYYGGEGSFAFHSISVQTSYPYYTDSILWALFALCGALWIDRLIFAKKAKLGSDWRARVVKAAPLLLVLCLALLMSYPAYRDFIPDAHDGLFHLSRIEGIAAGLKEGQFPVRIHPTTLDGKGYANGLMYPELFLYPFALLRLAHMSLTGVYQLLCVSLNLLTAATAYLLGRRLFASRWAGCVLAMLYTVSAYRANNMYVRGAWGEVLAMAFLPLVALGLCEIFFGDANRWPVAVAGYFGIMQSHILSVFMVGLFSIGFGVLFIRRLVAQPGRLGALLKAAGLTLGLNLWFIIPFVYMNLTQPLRAVNTSYIQYLWHTAIYPAQLFMTYVPVMGDSRSVGSMDTMPMNPGLLLLFMAAAAAALLLRRKTPENRPLFGAGLFSVGLAVFSLWLTSTLFPWRLVQNLPVVGAFFGNIQFVWRFLSMATLALAMCGAFVAASLRPRQTLLGPVLLAAVMAFSVAPRYIMDNSMREAVPVLQKSETLSQQLPYVGEGEYMYNGVLPVEMIAAPNEPTASNTSFILQDFSKRGTVLHVVYTGQGLEYIDMPLMWYPGYTARDADGTVLHNERAPSGLVRVIPGADEGSISVRYTGLWWFRIGDAASLAVLAGCVVYGIVKRRRLVPKTGPKAAQSA